MDENEIREAIEAAVKAGIAASGLDEIKRKLTTGEEKSQPEVDRTGGYKYFSEFCLDVVKASSGRMPVKLGEWLSKTAGHMEEGDMSQGGYLVPEEFRAQLMMMALEGSIVRARAMGIPMSTNRVSLPAVVDTTHASGTYFGGVQIYRPGEAGTKTASKPALGKVSLTLHKLTGLVYVSDELLEDSPISIEPLITTMFGQAIAFVEDDDYLNGNGTNQPLGAFNAGNPSLVSQAKETGQAAATILAENVIKMWSRLYAPSQARAIWVANNECFPQLATMSLAVGTGGIPVYLPAGGVSGAPFATLMGRPLILTEKMQALGTVGDIGLADFSQYLVADKVGGGLKTATSIHVNFAADETAFRFVLRYDGQPWWQGTLTPRRGSNTLSPFVVLATRS